MPSSEVSKWPIQPEYPVIFEKPDVSTVFLNFSFRDYMKMVSLTSGSMVWGYLAGGRSHVRGSAMCVAGIMGLQAGYMWAYMDSTARLQGLYPNPDEFAKFRKGGGDAILM